MTRQVLNPLGFSKGTEERTLSSLLAEIEITYADDPLIQQLLTKFSHLRHDLWVAKASNVLKNGDPYAH